MRRHVSLTFMACILSLAGCSTGPKVRPEPVSFNHPDEVIRGEGFMVLADRREFAVMAFLNATGFDEEVQGQQMHPLRTKVRELVAANLAEHPKKVKAWRKYRNGLVRKYVRTYDYQELRALPQHGLSVPQDSPE